MSSTAESSAIKMSPHLFARQLDRRSTAPLMRRVDQVVRRVEQLRAVEEERALLRKNSALRGSNVNWLASASTCEKSGLIVPFSVRFGVTPHRTLPPPSSGRFEIVPPTGLHVCRSERAVATGLEIQHQPRCRLLRPSRVAGLREERVSRARRRPAVPPARCSGRGGRR